MSDRAAMILGVCILLGCGAVAWSNWAISQAHREQAEESRRQAVESRQQAKELAAEDRHLRAGLLQVGSVKGGLYQLLVNSEGKPTYLMKTETGEVWKADLDFQSWKSAVRAVK